MRESCTERCQPIAPALTLLGIVCVDTTAHIRATCLRCRAIVSCAVPLGERDVEALAAHLRTCGRIAPTERLPERTTIGNVLWYFAVGITFG